MRTLSFQCPRIPMQVSTQTETSEYLDGLVTAELKVISRPFTAPYALGYLSTLDKSTLDEIGRLRIVAWEASGERPTMAPTFGDIWLDEHDEHAHHWILRQRGEILAAARMCVHESPEHVPDKEDYVNFYSLLRCPIASINRLVVHPRLRGNGLPKLFDKVRIRLASRLGVMTVIGSTSRASRVRDLEEIGFRVLGHAPVPRLPTCPNIVLLRIITDIERTSAGDLDGGPT